MINGYLRWTDGYEARPCNDLCVELALACESWELFDALDLSAPHTRDNESWRRIVSLLVPLVRFWGEPDEPVPPEVTRWATTVSFHHGP